MFPCPLVVLAGGRATRLGKLAEDTPKFLMPIDQRRRFADIHLEWVRGQGFRDVTLCLGYLGKQIEDYCGDGSRYGLKLRYSYDGASALGTGGALKKALPRPSGPVALTYGDTILAISARTVYRNSRHLAGDVHMTVFKNTVPGHVCNANIAHHRVEYSKSSPRSTFKYIDYGFLILNPSFIAKLPAEVAIDLAVPLEASSRVGKLTGEIVHTRFWEMGTPESYEEFRKRYQTKQ